MSEFNINSFSSNRQEDIHSKGFRLGNHYVKQVKLGNGPYKTNEASVNLKTAIKNTETQYTKEQIQTAIANRDMETLRKISNYYYDSNGIYKRVCEYIAFLFKYDNYVVPYINNENAKPEKILADFYSVLKFLDNSRLKKRFADFSLQIMREGCYYGYRVDNDDRIVMQDLPIDYCRSRFFIDGKPTVEFNMKFFDDKFTDTAYRSKILDVFPKEFSKGYILYKNGDLPADQSGDKAGWYLLDPTRAVKFNLNGSDIPYFIEGIPAILDLQEAQEIDKKRMMQQLLKIFIQKLPIDKNGDLIFDVVEAKDLHANAVEMLADVLGIDVVTTFADVDIKDLDNTTSTTSSMDNLKKVERSVYNQLGVPQNIFNADGNVALNQSIVNDESSAKSFLYQYEVFVNDVLDAFKWNKNKKNYYFQIKILETTIYNYKEMAKLYKEQVTLGYSKLLPQIALGHTQSEILAELYFENNILDLTSLMTPAQMSSTQSSKKLDKNDKTGQHENQNVIEDKSPGRKELPDEMKSDKTLQNREAMS